MTTFLENPHRGEGLPLGCTIAEGDIATDPSAALVLLALCPAVGETPLVNHRDLATALGIGQLVLKDERQRMGLGSFKALGAAHAIAKRARIAAGDDLQRNFAHSLSGQTFICASAGNHGLSVAAGAKVFGATAIIYLSMTVPESFAARLQAKGARVVRAGHTYEESMAAAKEAAAAHGWHLLSDSTWVDYTEPARDVMEGYLIMGDEVSRQIGQAPTHIFLQAGVGGLAAAAAASARRSWGDKPRIIVVEPVFAPALFESIKAGRPIVAPGPVSSMGRLDCKEPSHLALKYLAREADAFMTITEGEAAEGVRVLQQHGISTSPSGGAGFAGLLALRRNQDEAGLGSSSCALVYISEDTQE
jgi:diaminopropionate ammonia-lyase